MVKLVGIPLPEVHLAPAFDTGRSVLLSAAVNIYPLLNNACLVYGKSLQVSHTWRDQYVLGTRGQLPPCTCSGAA